QVDHQRNVAVGLRREQELLPQLRKPGRDILPTIEPVPGQVEIMQDAWGKAGDAEPRQDALQVAPMQHVEAAERNATVADLVHGRLIFSPPRIRERDTVDRMAEGAKKALGLAGDAGAPVDQRAEHVEQESFAEDGHRRRTIRAGLPRAKPLTAPDALATLRPVHPTGPQ